MIRMLFDAVMKYGESYNKADAISSDCTRDGLVNRVYIKKLHLALPIPGMAYVDNVTVTCAKEDYSDATDAELYYISIALHCFGLINITSKNVTFLKSIIPFYYWIRG